MESKLSPFTRSCWAKDSGLAIPQENQAVQGVKGGLLFPVALGVIALFSLLVPKQAVAGIDTWLTVSAGFLTLAAISAAAFSRARRRGDNPWTDATAAFSFFYAVFFGGGLLVLHFWASVTAEAFPDLVPHFQKFHEVLPDVARLTLLGGASLILGTLLPARKVVRILPGLRWSFDSRTFFRRSLLFLPVTAGTLAATTLAPELIPSGAFHVTKLLGEVSFIILILAACHFFAASEGRWKWALLYALHATPLCLTGLHVGMRGTTIVPMAMWIYGYMIARRRMPWKYVVVGCVVLLTVLIPWTTFLKQTRAYEADGMAAMVQASARLGNSTLKERVGITLWSTVRRFAAPGNFAACRSRVPDLFPHQHGKVLKITLQSLPPRAIWPGKPNVSAELNRYSRMLGVVGKQDRTSSAVFNALGLYYMDFGAAGILILGLFHGSCIRLFREWTVGRCNYQWGAAVFLFLTLSKPDLHDVFVWGGGAVRMIVVSLPVLYLLSCKEL